MTARKGTRAVAQKIATSIPAAQYRDLELARRKLKLNRSEAVQKALAFWLSAQKGDARTEQYIRAYLAHPEDEAEGAAYVEAWAAGQSHEEW
jgi:hypothetical protein